MRKIIVLSLLCTVALCIHAKKQKGGSKSANSVATVYMFGVSASFNDSIVYFTDLQEVGNAYYEKKVYLGGFKEYSDQMNRHFMSKTGERRTNAVFFKKSAPRQRRHWQSCASVMQIPVW